MSFLNCVILCSMDFLEISSHVCILDKLYLEKEKVVLFLKRVCLRVLTLVRVRIRSEKTTPPSPTTLYRRLNLIKSRIFSKHFRHSHSPIFILIILNNRKHGPICNSRAIESVNKFFFSIGSFKFNITATSLIICGVTCRSQFAIFSLSREPSFTVIFFSRRE